MERDEAIYKDDATPHKYHIIFVMHTFLEKSRCKLDLGLVVDTTKSIKEENIPKLKAALQQLVSGFEISPQGTHVSFETFAEESTLHNTFNNAAFHSEGAVLKLISSSINELRQPTRLDRALKTASEQMFSEENGIRHGVRKAMVLFTDGRSHPDTMDFHLDIIGMKVRTRGSGRGEFILRAPTLIL